MAEGAAAAGATRRQFFENFRMFFWVPKEDSLWLLWKYGDLLEIYGKYGDLLEKYRKYGDLLEIYRKYGDLLEIYGKYMVIYGCYTIWL